MDTFLAFFSLIFLLAGLGIDNGLLIEFSIRSLNLQEKTHFVWRSIALVVAALMRILFLFGLSLLGFLYNPLPDSTWLPMHWFSKHPEDLTWMSAVLFGGGVIILMMALWEYYHKLREQLEPKQQVENTTGPSIKKIMTVIFYLTSMNVLFSVDSVFAAVAMMSIETEFWWMVSAVLIASFIMIFGMIPISAIIAKNKHFGVLMLTILAVIGTKLLVDGTGSHFSNGLLIFIICVLLVNDAAQALIDRAAARRESNLAAA